MAQLHIPEENLLTAIQLKLSTDNVKILSYTLQDVETKVGLLGDHAFIKVIVLNEEKNTENNLRFFVKSFPKQPTLARFAQGAGSFPREEFVYDFVEIFKKQGIDIVTESVPTCYFYSPSNYLLLDDLSEEGYKMIDKFQCLDYDTLLVILSTLSKLHASSLIYEEKKSVKSDEKFRIIHGNEERLKETLYSDSDDFANADAVGATLKGILGEIDIFDFPETLSSGRNFLESIQAIYGNMFKLVKPSKKHRNVLCHGDLWASNIMLKHDKTGKAVNCKIVDFQSVRYVPPAHDVMSLIYLTTSKELRQNRMYEAIGVYYNYLEKHLKNGGFDLNHIIPFEEFLESCDEQKLLAILFSAGILPLVLGDREIVEKYLCDDQLYQEAFREDRTVLVYENQNNELYMKRLKESMEDLMEVCEKI